MPGNAPYSGANRPYSFHRPTEIAWDPQGNIFVSDGFTDSRVVGRQQRPFHQVDRHAQQRREPVQYAAQHWADAQGNVYVADRGNSRIVVLNNDLNWKATYEDTGVPWGICISQTRRSISTPAIPAARTWNGNMANTGEIYKLQLDGKVLGRFRQGGESAARVRQHSYARLPQSERNLRGRDQCVAHPEGDAAPKPQPTNQAGEPR